jgi:hypothetical protein
VVQCRAGQHQTVDQGDGDADPAAKAYGPDLRLALLAGDRRTIERVHGREQLGPGWVSHLLQDAEIEPLADAKPIR